MSLYLDRKYLLLTSARLQLFKEKSADLYNFRCPFCGDSKKNKLKARGYIFKAQDYNGYGFKCWNCNVSTNFNNFLKFLDPLVYKDYVMEKFEVENKNTYSISELPKETVDAIKNAKMDSRHDHLNALLENEPIGLHNIDLPSINKLPSDHFARVYINNRLIPLKNWKHIYFTEDFKNFMDEVFPWHGKDKLKEKDPRIVMFYTDRAGYITTVNGRSFSTDPKQRYMKVKVVEYRKIFNLASVDLSNKIYLTEGEFDSMFLSNAIASGDSNLNGAAQWMLDTFDVRPICIFDKDTRNRELLKIIENTIEEGWDVCLLPESFPGKDINEAVLSGLTPKEIQSIIDQNTFTGLTAKLKLISWRRC